MAFATASAGRRGVRPPQSTSRRPPSTARPATHRPWAAASLAAAVLSPDRARVVEAKRRWPRLKKPVFPMCIAMSRSVVRTWTPTRGRPRARRGRGGLVGGESADAVFLAVSLVRELQCLHAIDETSHDLPRRVDGARALRTPHVIAATRVADRIDGVEAAANHEGTSEYLYPTFHRADRRGNASMASRATEETRRRDTLKTWRAGRAISPTLSGLKNAAADGRSASAVRHPRRVGPSRRRRCAHMCPWAVGARSEFSAGGCGFGFVSTRGTHSERHTCVAARPQRRDNPNASSAFFHRSAPNRCASRLIEAQRAQWSSPHLQRSAPFGSEQSRAHIPPGTCSVRCRSRPSPEREPDLAVRPRSPSPQVVEHYARIAGVPHVVACRAAASAGMPQRREGRGRSPSSSDRSRSTTRSSWAMR